MKRQISNRSKVSAVLFTTGVLCLAGLVVFMAAAGKKIKLDTQKQKQSAEKILYQKTQVQEVSLEKKYFYGLLEAVDKEAYREIVQGIQDSEEEIYVHCGDVDRANVIYQYVLRDYPEFFWCEGGARSTAYETDGETEEEYAVVRPVYLYTLEEREKRQKQIDKEVEACLEGIKRNAADYEKILYVYEYIVDTVDYEQDAADSQNIYSVFVNRKSVCAGYSRAAQYLLERLGVFCTYVTGTTGKQESHAWNLVMCGGEYYYLDTTWGDPVYQNTEGGDAPEQTYISYDYMCCDDDALFQTHKLDKSVEFPKCTSMKYNYYVVNGMYYDSYDEQQLLNKLNEAVYKKESQVILKFATPALYEQAKTPVLKDLVNQAGQNLCDFYGLSEVKYYYQDEADLNKITIYWQYE